jgi:hypothetical protein
MGLKEKHRLRSVRSLVVETTVDLIELEQDLPLL